MVCLARLLGQAVKTPPFHGGNMGSNPVGVIYIWRDSQVVRQWSATPVSAGSNPARASKALVMFRVLFLCRLVEKRMEMILNNILSDDDRSYRIDDAIYESEQEIENGAEATDADIVFAELDRRYFE